MAAPCRLLIDPAAAGPWNMAADEVLLDDAAAGVASLRFYAWAEPTLSLGYFQGHRAVRAQTPLSSLAWLRRPTGGAAIVHHHELTYALALPPGGPWQPPGMVWMTHFHELLRDALAGLGVAASICVTEQKQGDTLCFLHHTPGDLVVAGHKVAGSAQRKQRGALLQHGSLLLRRSPRAPVLPGVADLTGLDPSAGAVRSALVALFARTTGWALEESTWGELDNERIGERIRTRYGTAGWNEKR